MKGIHNMHLLTLSLYVTSPIPRRKLGVELADLLHFTFISLCISSQEFIPTRKIAKH